MNWYKSNYKNDPCVYRLFIKDAIVAEIDPLGHWYIYPEENVKITSVKPVNIEKAKKQIERIIHNYWLFGQSPNCYLDVAEYYK